MRNIKIAVGEYYHIFNRGINRQVVFLDETDRARFLFLILYFQSPLVFQNIGRPTREFVKHSVFNISEEIVEQVVVTRYVELVEFCLMPNHFHLILKEVVEGGTAKYMQRVLNGYTKYFNTKYKKSGHLFQGPYCAIHVENNRQLLHLSAYIHKNSRELAVWRNREIEYPWSSCQDFVRRNRFEKLLTPNIITGQFDLGGYENFIETSPAKMLHEELIAISTVYEIFLIPQ